MTRPTRTLATLLALLGSATMSVSGASAQSYQGQVYYPSPPAHHVPTTSYATTTYQPVYAAPAQATTYASPSYTTGTVATQPYGGQVLYRAAPVPSSTQTYSAPVSSLTPIDETVTYAPYYGTPQPVYRQRAAAPVPVYRAPQQPVQTWVRPVEPVRQPAYAPVANSGPQLGAPAVIGGLIGAAVLGAVLLDRKKDKDRKRRRARDSNEHQEAARRQERVDQGGRNTRRQERIDQERAAQQRMEQQRLDQERAAAQQRAEQQRMEQERAQQRAERQDRTAGEGRRAEGNGQARQGNLTEAERAERRLRRQARRQQQQN